MKVFVNIIKESVIFAFTELKVNKLRTLLTLLGVSIGIFCIISVFSVVDSLEKNIKKSIESLGSNVLYVQKWPWEFSSEYKWWDYINRPVPNLFEFNEIKNRAISLENVAFSATSSTTIEYLEKKINNISIHGVSNEFHQVSALNIEKGRFFNDNEFVSGKQIAVIGSKLAKELFVEDNPLDKNIKIINHSFTIIGVLEEEGATSFGGNNDNTVFIPVNKFRRLFDLNNETLVNTSIAVRVASGFSNEAASDEIRQILRSVRRLKPTATDNFSINESSLLTQGFQQLFKVLSLTAWIIGSFSLLVGGFGIANIMFVSVSERTSIIGIQKAVGVQNAYILVQYLSEAIVLSLIGGILGLLIVVILLAIITLSSEFQIFVSFSNILTTLTISFLIGIISGLAPAWKAAKLNPVIAIRK